MKDLQPGNGREFGIRSALGTTPRNLALLVFRYGGILVVYGAALGGSVALLVSRYLSNELYGVRVSDPLTWLWITALLGGIGLIASVLPSWRAARLNAAEMLKDQ